MLKVDESNLSVKRKHRRRPRTEFKRLDCEYPNKKSELESFETCCFNGGGVLASLSEFPLSQNDKILSQWQ